MTHNHSDWLDRAKQGDATALTELMNQYFQPQGVTAKALIKEHSLQVMLEAEQTPERTTTIAYLRQELSTWQPASVQLVEVFARQTGAALPDWEETFELEPFRSLSRSAIAQRRSGSAEFLATLRTFQFSSVVPYQDVFSSELYRSNSVKLLLFFGLFPLAVGAIVNPTNIQQTAWLLGIYYASIWGVVLFNLIKPAQFSWSDTLKCVLFTAFIGIPLLLLIQNFPPFRLLYAAAESRLGLIPQLIGFILGVGVLEELCKMLPVYLFLLRPRRLNEPLAGAFYGAMSGLGFAIAEGGAYSLLYALNLVRGETDFGAYVLDNTIRFVSLPLFHATLAGIVGYFLGLAAINRSRQVAILCIGVSISAALHGLYDTFASSLIGLVIIAFTILLFVAYLRRSQQLVAEMQEAESRYQSNDSNSAQL